MKLSDYLLGLRYGEKIDDKVVHTVSTELQITDSQNDPRWCYAGTPNATYEFIHVPAIDGKICSCLIPNGYEVLSTRFSGCYMAVYIDKRYSESAILGSHIWLDTKGNARDRREDWNTQVNNGKITDCTLFSPHCELTNGHDSSMAWGLIADRRCYTVIVNADMNGKLFLKAIELTPDIPGLIID